MTDKCQRCGDELGNSSFTVYEFGTLCPQCWDDYFELHKKIDLLKLQFIERGETYRRQP